MVHPPPQVAMAQRLWKRVVSSGAPALFEARSGLLELHASCLISGVECTLYCTVAGRTFAIGKVTEEVPSFPMGLRLCEEEATFSCNSGKILLSGLLQSLSLADAAASAAETNGAGNKCETGHVSSTGVQEATKSSSAETKVEMASSTVKDAPVASKVSAAGGDGEPSRKRAKKAEKPSPPIVQRLLKSGLSYEVMKAGSGSIAQSGKTVHVRYEGRLTDSGEIFDKGDLKFRLGMGEVIRGWDEGVQGMLKGERRRLMVPARLGYGIEGCPPKIPPNAALTFDVELTECQV